MEIFANQGINSGLGPVTSVFQFSQDSCSNSNSQFSQDFTDRFGSFNVRSQYGDNCTLNLSNSEDSNISFDMNCSSRPTSMRGVLNSVNSSHGNGNSMKNNNSNKNITLAQETRQIDIPQPLKNVFVEKALYEDDAEEFANRFGGNGGSRRPTKMWISAFRERSRYLSDFEEICVLGEGTFSSVFCVRHRLDGTLYAIKRLNQKIIHENQGKLMMREVNALSVLRGCPSIIQYYGCWLDDHHLCIQTELCHLGSLEDIISPTPSQSSVMSLASNNNSFQIGGSVSFKAMNGYHEFEKENQQHVVMGISEDLAWLLLNDICGALEFMHKKGIIFNRNKSNEDAFHREIYKSPTSVSSVNMFSANKENINRPIADNFHHAGTPLHKK